MEPRFQSSINPAEYTRQVNVTSPSLSPPLLPSFLIRAETRQAACLAAIPLLHAFHHPPFRPFLSPRRFFKLTEPPSPSSSSSLHRCRIWRDKPRYLAPTLLTSVSSTTTGGRTTTTTTTCATLFLHEHSKKEPADTCRER